jgi:hypothetical protein
MVHGLIFMKKMMTNDEKTDDMRMADDMAIERRVMSYHIMLQSGEVKLSTVTISVRIQ